MAQIAFNELKYKAGFEPSISALLNFWQFTEGTGTTVADSVRGNTITLTGSPTWNGNAVVFNGTTQYGQASVDLSAYNKITVSYWLYWDAFADDDDLAIELTPNFGMNIGGFFIDPNSAAPHSGAFQIGFNAGGGADNHADFPRPSAAAWHHCILEMDMGVNPNTTTVYVDNVLQTLSNVTAGTLTSNFFANSTLNFMSRNGTLLFGAGRMTSVRVYGKLLSAQEVSTIYALGRP